MRIILFASQDSDHLNMDVLALRELRGYGAVTVFEMGRPDYRGQGIAQSPQSVKHWLAVEMIEGAAIVLHPDTEPAHAVELDRVAAFLEAPCLHMSQLPDLPPEGEEAVELFRAEFTGLNRIARKQGQEAGAGAGAGAGCAFLPPTCPASLSPIAPAPVHYTAPSDFRIPVLEVDDEGNIIERPRTPREWFRDQLLRFRRWEERFNARYGRVLKNPVSYELRAKPKTYKLQTSPPPLTS